MRLLQLGTKEHDGELLRCMHDGEDLEYIVSHALHNAVRRFDHFAQHRIGEFGNDASRQRKGAEPIDRGHDTFSNDACIARGVRSDMVANVEHVGQGRVASIPTPR